MLKTASVLILSAFLLQPGQGPTLNRVTVFTRYHPGIILEYAERFLPEGESLNDGNVDLFRSQLLSTGLFTDVKVKVHQTENHSERAEIHVFPDWRRQANNFLIGELVFDGFTGINERNIRKALARKGVAPGSRLLRYPLQTIRRFLDQSIRETYSREPRAMHDFQVQLVNSTFKIEPIAPQQFRLTICGAQEAGR